MYSSGSVVYSRILEISGGDAKWLVREQKNRAALLLAMIDQKIHDFRDVSQLFWKYLAMSDMVLGSLDNLAPLLDFGAVAAATHRRRLEHLDDPVL